MADETAYSERSFWQKVRSFAATAGREVLEKALTLYYVMIDPETPVAVKTQIAAALGYFVAPVDALPDLLPLIGFSDDLGVLAFALTLVAGSVRPAHLERARAQVDVLLGQRAP
jgi:uncharacterized membrane protein YkvA (DUF1232 family)